MAARSEEAAGPAKVWPWSVRDEKVARDERKVRYLGTARERLFYIETLLQCKHLDMINLELHLHFVTYNMQRDKIRTVCTASQTASRDAGLDGESPLVSTLLSSSSFK